MFKRNLWILIINKIFIGEKEIRFIGGDKEWNENNRIRIGFFDF